jgi:hypothetical protein
MGVVLIVRWLLPWVCVVAVSATIAHAAGDALSRNLHEAPVPVVARVQADCNLDTCPHSHWVNISSLSPEGRDVTFKCLVTDARYPGDELQVNYADLNAVVAEMCNELWTTDS